LSRPVGQVALAWSWLVLPLLLPLWVMVIAAFPDGTFHRRLLGPVALAIGIVMALLAAAAYLIFPAGESLPLIAVHPPAELSGPLSESALDGEYRVLSVSGAVLGAAAPLLALAALADRYRTSRLVVRQQIKWLIAGATVSVLLQAIPVAAIDSEPLRTAAGVLVLLAVPLPLLAAAVAIFKHGLWEIDVVISHGLVYAVLSGALTLVFVAAAVAAGVTVGGADTGVVAAIALALLVSYLAHPLRQRLVTLVGRALYGEGPRGLGALSAQPNRHSAADARSQGARIADVTRSALGAPWVEVWLLLPSDGSGSGVLHPLAGTRDASRPPVVVSEVSMVALTGESGVRRFADLGPEAADILAPVIAGRAGLVAPLVADGDLLGVALCGDRPGDPYDDDELALLSVLAGDATLALRNLYLEEELRRRLEDIEAQAEELRRSRQRLVNAQDQERRRIERDLHDGAQQQLVALAVKIRLARTLSDRDVEKAQSLLDQLQADTQEALENLRDLARGIYPPLLADKGLAAALEAHARKVPFPVTVEPNGLGLRRVP
ncbi:MAG TPA: histidine kinase, partial [Pseudonocardiaceae bacterium]|nr:histidine kinase [Pseudonocardiaceae bacterium]